VTVFGDTVLAMAIASQESELSRHDFRGIAPDRLRHERHDIPVLLERQIQQFMQEQGLRFAAFDFALSLAGEYYFLENNPNGQWLWLELLTGVPYTDAMINLLYGDNCVVPRLE